ncbi:hypothetical protein Ahia01_001364900 [Argonauta hians]
MGNNKSKGSPPHELNLSTTTCPESSPSSTVQALDSTVFSISSPDSISSNYSTAESTFSAFSPPDLTLPPVANATATDNATAASTSISTFPAASTATVVSALFTDSTPSTTFIPVSTATTTSCAASTPIVHPIPLTPPKAAHPLPLTPPKAAHPLPLTPPKAAHPLPLTPPKAAHPLPLTPPKAAHPLPLTPPKAAHPLPLTPTTTTTHSALSTSVTTQLPPPSSPLPITQLPVDTSPPLIPQFPVTPSPPAVTQFPVASSPPLITQLPLTPSPPITQAPLTPSPPLITDLPPTSSPPPIIFPLVSKPATLIFPMASTSSQTIFSIASTPTPTLPATSVPISSTLPVPPTRERRRRMKDSGQLDVVTSVSDQILSERYFYRIATLFDSKFEEIVTEHSEKSLPILEAMYPELEPGQQPLIFHFFLHLAVYYKDTVPYAQQVKLPLTKECLSQMHRCRNWQLLAYLINGVSTLPSTHFEKLAENENLSNLRLQEILEDYAGGIPDWVDCLIKKILENGAPCEYLCAYGKAPVLHVAAKIATISGQFVTLCYIIDWAKNDSTQLNATDLNGETAFEMVCHFVRSYPLDGRKVLRRLFKADCEIPPASSDCWNHIPEESVNAELDRLSVVIKSSIQTKAFKAVAFNCKRGAKLVLGCHRTKDVAKYGRALYACHLEGNAKVIKSKVKKLHSVHKTFGLLALVRDSVAKDSVKQYCEDVGVILENISAKEESEVNRFLLEESQNPKSWPMIYFLLIGKGSQPPTFQKLNASRIDLSSLLALRKSTGMDTIEAFRILVHLLQNRLLAGPLAARNVHTIFYLALDFGIIEPLEYSLSSANINSVDGSGNTLLHLLVDYKEFDDPKLYIKIMVLLLNRGVNRSKKNDAGLRADEMVDTSTLPGCLLAVDNTNCCLSLRELVEEVRRLQESLTDNPSETEHKAKQILYYDLIASGYYIESGLLPQMVPFYLTTATAHLILGDPEESMLEAEHAQEICGSIQDFLLVFEHCYDCQYYMLALVSCTQACCTVESTLDNIKSIMCAVMKVAVGGFGLSSFLDLQTEPDLLAEYETLVQYIPMIIPHLLSMGNAAAMEQQELRAAFAFKSLALYAPQLQAQHLESMELTELDAAVFKVSTMQALLVALVKRGLDLRKLVLQKGDTYLHACVQLSLSYGYYDLLELIVSGRALPNNELYLIDNYSRTAFDLLNLHKPGNFHEETLNIMLRALSQVQNRKKILMTFPDPIYLQSGLGVAVERTGGSPRPNLGSSLPPSPSLSPWGIVTVLKMTNLTETDEEGYMGDESEAGVRTGNESETGVHMGDESEAVIETGNESDTTVQMAGESEAVIQMGNESKATLQMGDESEATLQMGGESEATLQMGDESEATVQMGDESEAGLQMENESEAGTQIKDESEAVVQMGDESEAGIRSGNESDNAVQMKDEREAAVRTRDESEAAVQTRDESEAAVQMKDESEAAVRTRDESEAAVRTRDENEAAVQMKDESEAAVRTRDQSEAVLGKAVEAKKKNRKRSIKVITSVSTETGSRKAVPSGPGTGAGGPRRPGSRSVVAAAGSSMPVASGKRGRRRNRKRKTVNADIRTERSAEQGVSPIPNETVVVVDLVCTSCVPDDDHDDDDDACQLVENAREEVPRSVAVAVAVAAEHSCPQSAADAASHSARPKTKAKPKPKPDRDDVPSSLVPEGFERRMLDSLDALSENECLEFEPVNLTKATTVTTMMRMMMMMMKDEGVPCETGGKGQEIEADICQFFDKDLHNDCEGSDVDLVNDCEGSDVDLYKTDIADDDGAGGGGGGDIYKDRDLLYRDFCDCEACDELGSEYGDRYGHWDYDGSDLEYYDDSDLEYYDDPDLEYYGDPEYLGGGCGDGCDCIAGCVDCDGNIGDVDARYMELLYSMMTGDLDDDDDGGCCGGGSHKKCGAHNANRSDCDYDDDSAGFGDCKSEDYCCSDFQDFFGYRFSAVRNDPSIEWRWRVVFTRDVLLTLLDQTIAKETRDEAITAIVNLANGPECKRVRRVKNVPHDVQLYTLCLSEHSRIIWQVVVHYFPDKLDHHEVICVWKVLFNLNNLKPVIDYIVRCQQSSLFSDHQWLKASPLGVSKIGKWYPHQYSPCRDIDGGGGCREDLRQATVLVDTASDENMVKLYQLRTSMVEQLKEDRIVPGAAFPFEIKEPEAIIVRYDRKRPFIVVGRSGTGKSTTCLYRVWYGYAAYWNNIKIGNGDPYIRKYSEETLERSEKDQDATQPSYADQEGPYQREDYTNLRQLVVSRNQSLCEEMERTFGSFCSGQQLCQNHVPFSGHCPEDLKEIHFPLFSSLKKFWVLADVSLGEPYFFPRNEDLSLRSDYQTWLEKDSINLIKMSPMDVDGETEGFVPVYEVTYDVFLKEFWEEIRPLAEGCLPNVMWTEIMSTIKGGYKALLSETGFLQRLTYLDLWKKKDKAFISNKKMMYDAFLKYDQLLKESGLFDQMDIVYNLFCRLRNTSSSLLAFHEIYIDEAHDLTQAELCLLVLFCDNPNHLFLTGDMAQNSLNGPGFRFSNLWPLFCFLKKIRPDMHHREEMRVPRNIRYLTWNRRSNSCIVSLVSSVLDLLNRYFPESCDKMMKNTGSYDGAKPKVIKFHTSQNLAKLLRGKGHTDNEIQFGPHQIILVANQKSKENLPKFLSSAIVLTIAESKGLEFNDVLLYNFFKDSPVTNEWRVVSSYLQELQDNHTKGQGSAELNFDILRSQNRPRPLSFDANSHMILLTELKSLYVALTRARHRVWIYDESLEKRAPMFEYFRALGLVECVKHFKEDVNGVLPRKSTSEEWLEKGEFFFQRQYFVAAVKCFQNSGHRNKETVGAALLHVQQAQAEPSAALRQDHFLVASQYFFEAKFYLQSAWCLSQGGRHELSARLYSKCHKVV